MAKDDELLEALRRELKTNHVEVPAGINSRQRVGILVALACGDPIDLKAIPSPFPSWFLLQLAWVQRASRRERLARLRPMFIAVMVNQLYNKEAASGAKPKLEAIIRAVEERWSVPRRAVFDALHKCGLPQWPIMVARKKRQKKRRSSRNKKRQASRTSAAKR